MSEIGLIFNLQVVIYILLNKFYKERKEGGLKVYQRLGPGKMGFCACAYEVDGVVSI